MRQTAGQFRTSVAFFYEPNLDAAGGPETRDWGLTGGSGRFSFLSACGASGAFRAWAFVGLSFGGHWRALAVANQNPHEKVACQCRSPHLFVLVDSFNRAGLAQRSSSTSWPGGLQRAPELFFGQKRSKALGGNGQTDSRNKMRDPMVKKTT